MKKRIALISEHASPIACLGGVDSGGQNVYVSEVARHISDLGFEVDIITRWDDAELPQIINWWPGVRVVHIKAGPMCAVEKELLLPYMDEFYHNLLVFIDEIEVRYDLVHANFWMSGLIAEKLKRHLEIPFVVTFHALGYVRKLYQNGQDRFPPERIDIERSVIAAADRIIAECPQDRIDLIQHYGANDDRIDVIPCGFNPNEFYAVDPILARRILGLSPHEKIILQLGRIVPRKGIDNVIQALGCLKRFQINARLVIVGGEHDLPQDNASDPEIIRLNNIARDAGVSDMVTFVGRKSRDVLRYYYSAADVFVTTPWYEPFGITPLESMACRTPVIGARVGGIQYSIEDGKTGLLVAPNRPEELAWKLELILKNDELRETMGSNGVKRAHRLFKWSCIAEQLRLVYDSIINGLNNEGAMLDKHTLVNRSLVKAGEVFRRSASAITTPIVEASSCIVHAIRSGNKILVCGNGGSAAESQHFVAELLGRFEIPDRRALPALSLTADTSFITAWSNDRSFEEVFSRQVEAYGCEGDVLVCFSTSGESLNVLRAVNTANLLGMVTIAVTGRGGGIVSEEATVNIIVPSNDTQRIQEMHLHIIHSLCSIIEMDLTGDMETQNVTRPIKRAARIQPPSEDQKSTDSASLKRVKAIPNEKSNFY
jgi:D-inositol-3-phosphate glycosyltransferase